MLIPLYAHWSEDAWRGLLERRDLRGHTVVINPNDGPFVKTGKERAGWRRLCERLQAKGARLVCYVDLCRATYEGDGWNLEGKTLAELVAEGDAAARLFVFDGLFLDDFTILGVEHSIAIAGLLSGIPKGRGRLVIGNPGTGIKGARRWRGLGVTHFVTHEGDGWPDKQGDLWMALGLPVDRKRKIPELCYAHEARDGKNPYGRLSGWFGV